MGKKIILTLLLLVSISMAEVTILHPIEKTFNDSLYLGKISPGQELKLVFSRETGPNGNKKTIFWEKAVIPQQFLINETIEGNQITTWIKIPEQHPTGMLSFNVTLQNNILYIMPEQRQITMNVSKNLYSFSYPDSFSSKAGEKIEIPVEIISESIAEEKIRITDSINFPLKWTHMPEIKFNGKGKKTAMLTVNPSEEGDYNIALKLETSTGEEAGIIKIHLRTTPTISSKLKAFEEGFSVTPIIMQPFYSFLSLLSYL